MVIDVAGEQIILYDELAIFPAIEWEKFPEID